MVDRGFPRLIRGLGANFGHVGDDRELREDGCIFEFAAIQMADDLADGDCKYLDRPERIGPGVQWLLQHLAYSCFLKSAAPRDELERAAHDFSMVGGAQQCEVRATAWTYRNAAAMAAGLNGRQYAAYFRILSAGTPHAVRAVRAGAEFGFALHVVTDRATRDRRWTSLSPRDRSRLAADARKAADSIARGSIASLKEPAKWFRAALARAQDRRVV